MNNTVTAIEVGTTKLAVLICRSGHNESLELSGLGQAGYSGVQNDGWKSDKMLYHAFDAALGEARKMAGVKISQCVLGIPNEFCGLLQNTKEVTLERPVTRQDVLGLRKQVASYPLPSPWKVADIICGSYLVDGKPVENPLELTCQQLSLQASVVCIHTEFAKHITKILRSLQIDVKKWIPVPLAGGEALLTKEERQKGALLIDAGGESIDVTVYQNGVPVFFDWLPLGGNVITRDIATGIGVSIDDAEKLKRFCVLGLDFNKDTEASEMNLPIREGKQIMNVPMELLQKIVEARVEEMLELVRKRMEAEGVAWNFQNVVLTGGGLALFRGIREFSSRKLDLPVKLGVPDVIGLSGPTLSEVYSIGCAGLKAQEKGITISKVFEALIRKMRSRF